jgi:hypothetical protein
MNAVTTNLFKRSRFIFRTPWPAVLRELKLNI